MTPDPADHNLATEQFPGLNEEFYRASPVGYIRRRVDALMLTIGRWQEVAAMLAQGVAYIPDPDAPDYVMRYRTDDEVSDEELANFATTEAVVLLHHASEALLRLFLAHEHQPPCPWLELARLRSNVKFKDEIEALRGRLAEEDQRERIAVAFLGSTKPLEPAPGETPREADTWRDHIDAAVQLLDLCAARLLGEGPLYNSAKHGLAVVAGTNGMILGAPNGVENAIDISVDGPSLTYLVRTTKDGDRPRWNRATSWVYLSEDVGRIFLVLKLMMSLWGIARARYMGEMEGVTIHTITTKEVEATVHRRAGSPIVIGRMTGSLLYYRDVDESVGESPTSL